jgi:type I restriction enzyme M protein
MPKQKSKTKAKAPPRPSPNPVDLGRVAEGRVGSNTKASLSSLIKSARDIMRKDAGLNGDLDRLPQLSWILFLKCYDDLELRREEDAKLERKAV